MERNMVLVTVVLATLGIAVMVAGFAAEATKVKRSQIRLVYYGLVPECHYPSSPSMGLAIAAVVVLMLTRSIVNSITGDIRSCCQPLPNMPKIGLVCIVISWISYFLSFVLFIVGAKLSLKNSVQTDINGVLHCYYVKTGLFSAAGIMGHMSVLLGIIYYFLHVWTLRRAILKVCVDLQLEKPKIADGNGMKPQVLSQNQ